MVKIMVMKPTNLIEMSGEDIGAIEHLSRHGVDLFEVGST